MNNEKKKHSKFKGYFQTIVCGLIVIAGLLFLILQYRSGQTADMMVYGSPKLNIPTIWVIVISALLGPVFMLCCWRLAGGITILYSLRRAEKRDRKQAERAVSKAKKELQAAVATAAPAAPEPEGDEQADDNDQPPA